MPEKDNYLTIRNVPAGLKREFKMLCAQEGKTLRIKLIELMSLAISEKK